MNNRGGGGAQPSSSATGDHQSPLSLLVNAADSRGDRGGGGQPGAGGMGDGGGTGGGAPPGGLFSSEALRRGLGGGGEGLSLEEQLLLQQQLQASHHPHMGLLGHLQRGGDPGLLSSLGQQQQLASLLGFGGGPGSSSDVHAALAHQLRQQQQQQQQQQQHQFTQADLLALSRSGALGGLSMSGLLGGGGPSGFGGLGSHFGGPSLGDYEGMQRLDELERRSRLLGMGGSGGGGSNVPAPGRTLSSNVAMGELAENTERSEASHPSPKAKQPDPDRRAGAARSDPKAKAKSSAPPVPSSSELAGLEDNKDELEKAPGSVIVPCRARGMPMDHNFKTAYFVIPENVKHGEELICSYFACRNAGIKFRYCSHCKVPVAKRNFRKRHKHGGEDLGNLADDSDGDDEVCVPVKKAGIPSQITASRKEEVEADGISSQSTDSNADKRASNNAAAARKAAAVAARKPPLKGAAAAPAATAPSGAEGGDDKAGADRRRRWMELLEKRPSTKQGDSMSSWLMEVLAVSDLETLIVPGESSTAMVSSDAKAKNAAIAAATGGKVAGANKAAKQASQAHGDTTSTDDESNGQAEKNRESKKRPADDAGETAKVRDDDTAEGAGEADSEFFVTGSFAAWKERKKAKKQAKMDSALSPAKEDPAKDEASKDEPAKAEPATELPAKGEPEEKDGAMGES